MTCFRPYDILAKTGSRMTTAITFSRQNDAGSRESNTQYWKNLVLVVVLVLESKDLHYNHTRPFVTLQPSRKLRRNKLSQRLQGLLLGLGGNWPIAERRLPCNDPRNNSVTHVDFTSLLVSKVNNKVSHYISETSYSKKTSFSWRHQCICIL